MFLVQTFLVHWTCLEFTHKRNQTVVVQSLGSSIFHVFGLVCLYWPQNRVSLEVIEVLHEIIQSFWQLDVFNT